MRLNSLNWRALTDVATLKQRAARAPTPVWIGLALVPPLLAGAVLFAARQAERLAIAQDKAAHAELLDLRAKAAAAPPADQAPFATRLPLTQSSARAVTHLREAAESQSVLVTTISATQQAPTANTLGRLNLDVNLRGSYAAIKTVLAEVLGRDAQQAVLQQLSLRRASAAAPGAAIANPAGGELEARVVATWLSRPLAEPASVSTAASSPASPSSSASAPLARR
jgi:hypothetical protein